MNIDPSELLPRLVNIAEKAGEEILKVYNTDFSVDNKNDDSPLTAADMASHQLIVSELERLTPDIPILSEESAAIPFSTRREWSRYWLVDPLDGTREFVKRNGEFTVNIALIEKGLPVAGVVYVPVQSLCYFSFRGKGAYKQSNGAEPEAIKTKTSSGDGFVVAGSRSHGSPEQEKFFSKLGEDVEVIAIGSSLKICLVAEGKVDIYPRFGPTSEWDTAAAHAIVLEAGGLVCDTAMNALKYNEKESVLNPHFLVIADPAFNWEAYL